MSKKALAVVVSILTMSVGVSIFFQNCSKSKFSQSDENNSIAAQSTDGVPGVDIGQTNSIPNSASVEVVGSCNPSGGTISVSAANGMQAGATCSVNGDFRVCLGLPDVGGTNVTVTQVNSSGSIATDIINVVNTVIPITVINIEITNVVVVNSSQGRITIKCEPGSAVSSTIYGAEQLPANTVCPGNGVITFDVALVPNLANSGQRVVYVTQTTQGGQVRTVFVDVDNVNKTHTCSITGSQANLQFCANSAGEISGTCKGGSPIKVLVNGVLQSVVICSANNTFVAKNIILTNPSGSNTISIQQTTPFATTCSTSMSKVKF